MSAAVLQVLLILQAATGTATPCKASTHAPALDHAIIVVKDLERAAAAFRDAGFRIKPGRLHANGLLNAHIKFANGGAFELMTVRGSPRDDMARDYAALLEQGDGGVYVALKVRSLQEAARNALSLNLGRRRSSSGAWQFLSFPGTSPAAAVFFTAGEVFVNDSAAIFRHNPPATQLTEVWVEGGTALGHLLQRLGAVRCQNVRGPDQRTGERWMLSTGSIVIVPPVRSRPRVLGAILESPRAARLVQPMPEFWVQYR